MKTHRFDSLSFVAGLFITIIGLAFLFLPDVSAIVDLFTDAGAWFWPVVFIAVGIGVLAPLLARGGEQEEVDQAAAEPTDEPAA